MLLGQNAGKRGIAADGVCFTPIMRFARILRRDIGTVHNAIELPWSDGRVDVSSGGTGPCELKTRVKRSQNSTPHGKADLPDRRRRRGTCRVEGREIICGQLFSGIARQARKPATSANARATPPPSL